MAVGQRKKHFLIISNHETLQFECIGNLLQFLNWKSLTALKLIFFENLKIECILQFKNSKFAAVLKSEICRNTKIVNAAVLLRKQSTKFLLLKKICSVAKLEICGVAKLDIFDHSKIGNLW